MQKQTPAPDLARSNQHLTIFHELEQNFVTALQHADRVAINDLLDERFRCVGFFGTTYTRGQYLDFLENKVQLRSLEVRSISVIEEANFSVVTSELSADITHDSSILKGMMRVTRVWVKRGETWKVLAFHLSDARVGEAWRATKKANEKLIQN